MANLSEHDIGQMVKNYHLDIFFETGTGNGDGLVLASKQGFKECHSVEIIQKTHSDRLKEYEGSDRVFIHYGKSDRFVQAFQDMRRAKPDCRVLWWLDAHFPGVDTGVMSWQESMTLYGAEDNMAEAELNAIMSGPHCHDVILIDDAFLFRAGLIDQRASDRVPLEFASYLGSLECLLDKLTATHRIESVTGHTGAICCYPKT